MKYATKKEAKKIIEREKEFKQTAYFAGELGMGDMKAMLCGMGFGGPEINAILAALVLAGGKFKID